jgi:hypothetical protein
MIERKKKGQETMAYEKTKLDTVSNVTSFFCVIFVFFQEYCDS